MSSLSIYLVTFFAAALFASLSIKKKSRFMSVLAVMVPAMVIGVRSDVGTDYAAYVYTYNLFAEMSLSDFLQITDDTKIEIGFYALIRVASILFQDQWGMFVLSALLSLSIAYYAIRKLAKSDTPIVYTLYLLLLTPFIMNGMRQGVAISIGYLAISYIISGNFRKYLLCVVVGSLFHSSILILLPLYLLRFLVTRKSRGAIIDFAATLTPALLVGLTIPVVMMISSYIPVLNQYLGYTGMLTGISPITATLKLLLVSVVFLTFSKISVKYPEARLFAALFFLEMIFVGLGTISGVFARLQFYVSIAGLLYIAKVPSVFSAGSRRVAQFAVMSYGLLYFLLAYYIAGYSDIFPYQTIIEVMTI